MIVYVALHGYAYEGQDIKKIFLNEHNAVEYIAGQAKEYNEFRTSKGWVNILIKNNDYSWSNHNEYYSIEVYEIDDKS